MARFVSTGAAASMDAGNITYDNVSSGLSSTNVKAALDEIEMEKQPSSSGKSIADDLGIISSGTIMPEPSNGALKTLTNGGAFNWSAPAEEGGYLAYVQNNGSAGAITPSGFDHEDSTSFDTTDTNEFEVCITNDGVRKIMTVRALQ